MRRGTKEMKFAGGRGRAPAVIGNEPRLVVSRFALSLSSQLLSLDCAHLCLGPITLHGSVARCVLLIALTVAVLRRGR